MKRPHINAIGIYIPADEKGFILPEYQDPVICLGGRLLEPEWGTRSTAQKGFCFHVSHYPESDLAIVKMVFRRNRKRSPLCMKQHILDVMGVETLAEAREKMREAYPHIFMSFHNFVMSGTFNFHTDGEDVADFYGDEEPDYEKYSQQIFDTL